MTKDDVIRMAREAGFEKLGRDIEDWVCFTEEIVRFAELVALAKCRAYVEKIQELEDFITELQERT